MQPAKKFQLFFSGHKCLIQSIVAIFVLTIVAILVSPFPHYIRIYADGRYAVRALLGSDFYSSQAVASSENAMSALEEELLTRKSLTFFSMGRICGFFGTYRRGAKDCLFAEKLYSSHIDENRTFLSLYIKALNACQENSKSDERSFIKNFEAHNGYTDECDMVRRYLGL